MTRRPTVSEPTKYPQVPFIHASGTYEGAGGRRMFYHALSDGRIVGYWDKTNGEPSAWVEVAPAIPDAMLEGEP
jgi:hypothetical protein